MILDELPTPCLLVERSRLESNLQAMQARADDQGIQLRPHIKTHKSLALARMQADRGARGITCAKVGEAERFVGGGFDDVRIAYPVVGADKLERVVDLVDAARVSFCIDTIEGAKQASEFMAARDVEVDVLLIVNVGNNRCGIDPDDDRAVRLARDAAALPGLNLAGILTHAGQVYKGPADGESKEASMRRVSDHERDVMLRFAGRLREAGVAEPGRFEISVGSTPTAKVFESRELDGFRVTEMRPGNYVFYDAMQVTIGSATLDECALTVLTTVVSRHRNRSGRERLFADAGSKVVTTDAGAMTEGYGQLLYNARRMQPMPHARITGLSEEHAWIEVAGGSTLEVGSRIRFVPNHACVCMNLQDLAYVVDGEEVVDTWPIDARGRVI